MKQTKQQAKISDTFYLMKFWKPLRNINTFDHSITIIMLIFTIIVFSTLQLSAQKANRKSNSEKVSMVVQNPNSTQALNDKIEFKNSGSAILTITDEGNNAASLLLPTVNAVLAGNKLYNNGGTLYWGNSAIGAIGGASSINDLSDAIYDGLNLFVGKDSGPSITTGGVNTAFGKESLFSTTSGNHNAAFGYQTLRANTEGHRNVALGNISLNNNTLGDENIAIGYSALSGNTLGGSNVGIGYNANAANREGSRNVAIGWQAGNSNVAHSKSGNIFLGYRAGYNELGDDKLYIENSNSTTPLIWGDFANDDIKINGDFHVTGNITTDGTVLWKENSQITRLIPETNSLGIGTPDGYQEAKLMVLGNDGVLFQGLYGSGATSALSAGTRFHFYPKKAAIRSGYINGSQWDDSNIGNYSTAFGQNTIASGNSATASGFESTAGGNSSIALGYRNTSSGNRSAAIGSDSKSESFSSFSIGRFNLGGGNAGSWVDTDPLFEIGNGTSTTSSNAMTVLKNGKVGIGTHTPSYNIAIHENSAGVSQMSIQNDDTGINGLRIGLNISEQAFISNDQNQDMFFSTNGTERMRIKNDGKVGVARTPTTYTFEVGGSAGKTSGGTAWNVISDIRMKDILGNYKKGMDEIGKLRTVRFKYKENNSLSLPSNSEEYGFIAQEVQKIFPEAVSEHENGYLDFNIHPINIAMVNAVQELSKENKELKNMIKNIEKKLYDLESKLTREKFTSTNH